MAKNPAVPHLVLSRRQVRACDTYAIEHFKIPSLVLMENAGSAAARYILDLLDNPADSGVCIIAGSGNNAGDGFVVARHLSNETVNVEILICGSRDRLKPDALANLVIVENMKLPIHYLDTSSHSDEAALLESISQTVGKLAGSRQVNLVVDALLGTGATGPPKQPLRAVIEALNQLNKTVVALDIPSGLDCDTGKPLEVAVRAHHTITFAAMKKGFLIPDAQDYIGKVSVASIGISTALLKP